MILKNIIDKYGNYHKISSFCYGFLKDAYYLKRRYDKAWEYLLKESSYSDLRIRWEDIINIRFRYSKAKLTGEEYLRVINNKRITAFVLHNEENRRLFVKHIEKYFDEFRKSFGKEFVKYYLDKYSFEKIPVHMLSDIEKQYSEENKIIQSAKFYIHELNKRRRQVTKKEDINTVKISILSSEVFIKSYPNVAYEILDFELTNLLRELENNFRVENGIPKIGEGWISETQLFYEIKKEFQGETVVRQGKPKWLKKQRFDIYFPDYNVAVEYQGEQHERPIDFFWWRRGF